MKLGRIPWINCYPVYGAIDRGLVSVPAELVSGTASELNDLLAAGELQVSVVSAVEYARNAAEYHLLPDLAITWTARSTAWRSSPGGRWRSWTDRTILLTRVLPHLGAAARPALPPSLGRAPQLRDGPGGGGRPGELWPDCRTRRCS